MKPDRAWFGLHRARALTATAAIALFAFLAIGAAGPPVVRANGPCTDVEIVGLRGSSEDFSGSELGMGSLLGPVADTIVTQLSGQVTFSVHGVPYPAADAISGVITGDYFESKQIGSDMLHDYLLERAIECPAAKFVVMGYSQGAHAAGDQLAREGTFITDRIAALVMFGDPRFNPEASYVWGTYDSRDHGLAGARSLGDFAGWASRVFSFCRHNDKICQGLGWDHSSDEHAQEKYVSDYADLVAGLVRRRLGLTQLPRVPLDLAFVIDSTGSMSSSIEEVREGVSSMVDTLEDKESDYRIGLADYKDTDQGDPYAAQLDLDLSTDVAGFRDALAGLAVYGGGDYPEAVFSGLMKAFTGLNWRSDSRKAVILMGDAPGKDPEPITGFTGASVLQAARSISGGSGLRRSATLAGDTGGASSASIYPVAVGFGPLETFEPLADESGGKVFFASGSSEVSEQILEAVDNAATPVEVVMSSVSPARPGQAVEFKAKANYAPGEIIEYAWDFDGDGIVDETDATGTVLHAYPAPFDGFAEVTAIADDGHEGSAATAVSISEDAPQPAGPPRQLTVSTSLSSALNISWQPPLDLGGGILSGYEVAVENSSTGQLEFVAGLEPSANQIQIEELPTGSYAVTVAAATEAGLGAPALGNGSVGAASAPEPGGVVPPAASTAPLPSPRRPARCRKGFRVKRAHGRAKCVKRKARHRRHHSKGRDRHVNR